MVTIQRQERCFSSSKCVQTLYDLKFNKIVTHLIVSGGCSDSEAHLSHKFNTFYICI